MARSFFEVAAAQRRRSAVLLVMIGLFYFIVVGAMVFAVRAMFWILGGSPGHRSDWASEGPRDPGAGLDEILWQTGLFAALVGGGVLLLQYWFARRHAVETILSALHVREPDRSDRFHRRFENLVEEMRIAAGAAVPVRTVVMPSLVPAAFAAQDSRSGAVIGVTEGLLGLLNRDEAQAVVAHEMTHVREGDASIAAFTCALLAPFAALADWLERLGNDTSRHDSSGGDAGAGLGALVAAMMRLACTALSRERETLADAGAVELTRNPGALASALMKLNASNTFLGGMAAAYAPIFILDPGRTGLSEREGWLSNLLSSHPPVGRRLAPLLAMAHLTPLELEERMRAAPGPDAGPDGGPDGGGEREPVRNTRPWLGAPEERNCPACRVPLHEADYEGVRGGHCTACEGHLVESEKLSSIVSRREMQFGEAVRAEVRERYGGPMLRRPSDLVPTPEDPHLACPACAQPMTRQHYSYQILVIVDRCFGCKLTWFGRHELEAIQILLEEKRTGARR